MFFNPLTFILGVGVGCWLRGCLFDRDKGPSRKGCGAAKRPCENVKPPSSSNNPYNGAENGGTKHVAIPPVISGDYNQELVGNGVCSKNETPSIPSNGRKDDSTDLARVPEAQTVGASDARDSIGEFGVPSPGIDEVPKPCRQENKAVARPLDAMSELIDALDARDNGFTAYLKNELTSIMADFTDMRFSIVGTDGECEDGKVWFRFAKRIGAFLEELDGLLMKGDSAAEEIRKAITDINSVMLSNGASPVDVDAGFDSLKHRNMEFFFIPTGTAISETVSPGLIADGQIVKRALIKVDSKRETTNE